MVAVTLWVSDSHLRRLTLLLNSREPVGDQVPTRPVPSDKFMAQPVLFVHPDEAEAAAAERMRGGGQPFPVAHLLRSVPFGPGPGGGRNRSKGRAPLKSSGKKRSEKKKLIIYRIVYFYINS